MFPTGASRLKNLIEVYSVGLSSHTLSLEARRFTLLKLIEQREPTNQQRSVKAARRIEDRLLARISETGLSLSVIFSSPLCLTPTSCSTLTFKLAYGIRIFKL
jgi:hypothetical protein